MLGPADLYTRLQPTGGDVSGSMDDIRPESMAKLERGAAGFARREEARIEGIAKALLPRD